MAGTWHAKAFIHKSSGVVKQDLRIDRAVDDVGAYLRRFHDGATKIEWVETDPAWKVSVGPIRTVEFDGEGNAVKYDPPDKALHRGSSPDEYTDETKAALAKLTGVAGSEPVSLKAAFPDAGARSDGTVTVAPAAPASSEAAP